MRAITSDEIFTVLKTSSSRKVPGADGLPKEFYVKTWIIISNEITLVINDVLAQRASQDFHNGIKMLFKKKGGDSSIKSYRPISLLNCGNVSNSVVYAK